MAASQVLPEESVFDSPAASNKCSYCLFRPLAAQEVLDGEGEKNP